MTEIATSHSPAQEPIRVPFPAPFRALFRAPRRELWSRFPREIQHRGGSVTRDDERAYRDLQAARDRSEW